MDSINAVAAGVELYRLPPPICRLIETDIMTRARVWQSSTIEDVGFVDQRIRRWFLLFRSRNSLFFTSFRFCFVIDTPSLCR